MSRPLTPHTATNGQTVIVEDGNGRPMYFLSTTVPTDTTAGYPTGCICIKTNGGAGTTLYVNEGSVTSCDFNAK